ncbi:isochorismatase family protein, partial [Salmonella enterica]|nr:isochorismatase family protein [Salmonella enterica]
GTIEAAASVLLMVDLQARLMPAIADGEAVLREAKRLLGAAALCGVPALFTEQNPGRLGATVPELAPGSPSLPKMCFDAARDPGFAAALPDRPTVLIAGVEAHVCVLQTALSLVDRGRRVAVVEDAVGSRAPASKAAALRRMERHGVEIVTAEMAVFEWLGSAIASLN